MVLLSEGSSLSARQAITALGIVGHLRRSLRPGPALPRTVFAIRYSLLSLSGRWRTTLGLPQFRGKPLNQGGWEVLFPTNEQAFLF
jgi:hypothetical protein